VLAELWLWDELLLDELLSEDWAWAGTGAIPAERQQKAADKRTKERNEHGIM